MKIALPPQLHHARTVRVQSFNCLEVDLDLNYGVSVRKNIVLEGVQSADVPRHLRKAAQHALVVLVGGKRLIVHTERQDTTDGYIQGRVYLAERVYGSPEGIATPYGLDLQLLEVTIFCRWLKTVDYDLRHVKAILNGRGK